MDPDSSRLRVSVSDGAGRAVSDGGLSRWLAGVAPRHAAGDVGIALVSDARMRTLNRQFRKKDTATDVLSFPADGCPRESVSIHQRSRGPRLRDASATLAVALAEATAPARARAAGARDLGDIVIATGVARRQAKAARHSYQAELRVLALHGLLHLLGYDHDDAGDAGRMARVESRLRRKGGLGTGLIERAAPKPKAGLAAPKPKAEAGA